MSVNLKSNFSWASTAQKTNKILDKMLPCRAGFCLIFRLFFGQWRFEKNCFWDLLTLIRMLIFTIYCKKHLHLLRYFKNSQNTWDFINYFIPLCFTWPVWYDTILPSGSSELYSFFHFFLQQKILILIILKWNLCSEI